MKNTKHTQGNWIMAEYLKKFVNVRKNTETDVRMYSVQAESDLKHICDVKTTNVNDARLIAAAPDLLEALESLLDAYNSHLAFDERIEVRRNAVQAIQKAKGEV